MVNLEMEGGLTVNFTMSAFTAGGGRYTNFMGTMGDMIADMAKNTVTVTPFGGKPTVYDFNLSKERMSGHAGGDSVLIGDFLDYLQGQCPPSITTLEASMESHFMALAAEESNSFVKENGSLRGAVLFDSMGKIQNFQFHSCLLQSPCRHFFPLFKNIYLNIEFTHLTFSSFGVSYKCRLQKCTG